MTLMYRSPLREAVRAARQERKLIEEIERDDALALLANRPEQHAAVRRGRQARLMLLRARLTHLQDFGPRPAVVEAVTAWASELDTERIDALLRALDAREDE